MKKGYITIKGNEYPCRFTMGAMLEVKNRTGVDLVKGTDAERMDFAFMAMLLFCCLLSSCRADGVEMPVKDEMALADHLQPEDFVKWQQLNLDTVPPEDSKKKNPA